MKWRTFSVFSFEKFVLLAHDEEVVFLHGVETTVFDVAHQFDFGVGTLANGLQLQVLVEQLALG